MIRKETIEMSPEGYAFREHIIGLLTKTFFSEAEYGKTLDYLNTETENGKFEGKGREEILNTLNIKEHDCRFEVSGSSGKLIFSFCPGQEHGSVIMYLHGGAYVFGYTDIYFRFHEVLAEACGSRVVAPIYTLASGNREGISHQVYESLVSAYLELAEEGKPVFVMGDSSGGAMALRLCQMINERHLPKPAGLIMFSPFVDASFDVPVSTELQDRDITVDMFGLRKYAELWAGERELSDPEISPLQGLFDGIPETLIVACTDEVFLPSNELLAHRIDAAGGDVRLVECTGSYHIFPVYAELPESKKVMEMVRSMVCRS